MMNKRRTKEIGRTKYLLFLPLAALLMIVSNIEMIARTTGNLTKDVIKQTTKQIDSQSEVVNISQPLAEVIEVATLQDKKGTQQEKPVPQKGKDQDEVVFEVVEEMPDFPGGMQALMEYLSRNVKYPAVAHANGTQGRVIVSFVVKKDGSISDIKTVRNVDPYLDKEAERVIAAMPNWKPGKQRGQAVNVRFTVPVMFKLTGPEPTKAEEIKESNFEEIVVVGLANREEDKTDTETVLKVAEKMPAFPGGQAALMQYLAKSIKYPTIAQKNKEQGRVIIQMIIGKDGNMSDIKIIKGISPTLDAEAIRVISNMPKWEPGMDKGKAISVKYTIPVTFRLQ